MDQHTPKMRIAAAVLLLGVSTGLAACNMFGGGDSPTAPTGPPAAGSKIVYSAVGASDVVGYGSSKPCLPFEDCNGNGYVWVAARQLRSQGFPVDVAQLGIPAGVLSRSFQDLGVQHGVLVAGNFIQSEMPFVKPEADLVTIFAGANDVNVLMTALGDGAGGTDPGGFIDQRVATFRDDYMTLINGIRDRAGSARIIVFNLPNLAGVPYRASNSTTVKRAAQRASVGMTTTAINIVRGVTVIDLMCDPRFYQASTFSSDGFHPNDAGYAIMGQEIAKALTSQSYPAPRASCPQMSLY